MLPLPVRIHPPHRAPLVAATLTGAVGMASLPLALAYPGQLWPYLLSLAATVSVALVGDAVGLRWLRVTGAVVTAVVAASPLVGFGQLLAVTIVLGPLAVGILLGDALRRRDPFAGTAFLTAAAIAITGGFAAAAISPPIVVGVTIVVLAGGTAVTLNRLP